MTTRPVSKLSLTQRLDPSQLSWRAAQIAIREKLTVRQDVFGDDSVKENRELMVALARDMYQNNALYSGIINRMVMEVIGNDGFELKPTGKRQAVNKGIVQQWLGWCEYADYEEDDDFTELERRIFAELLNVGEVLLVKIRSNQTLQIIETERIEKIEYKKNGAPESFVVSEKGGKQKSISADDAIFLCLKNCRKSQERGSGVLWSCMDIVHMLMFILRSSAKSWGVISKIAAVINKEEGSTLAAQMRRASNGESVEDDEEEDDSDVADRLYDLPEGFIFVGKQGENISPVSHAGVPNADIEKHIMIYLRIISAEIGFDAATVLLNDFTKTNYSSSRAARVALSKTVGRWQSLLRRRLYNRVYRWLAGGWIASGSVRGITESALTEYEWIPPKPMIIDNKGEAEANEKELAIGVVTHDQLILERNGNPESIEDQRIAEIDRISKKVSEMEAVKNGTLSHSEMLHHLAGVPMGKTQAAQIESKGVTNEQDD